MFSFEENSIQIQRLYKETSAFHISPMEVSSHSSRTIAKKTGSDMCDLQSLSFGETFSQAVW